VIIAITLGLLIGAAAFAVTRLLRGPTLADRIIALDVVLVTLMSAIAVNAVREDTTLPLAILVSIAIIAFTATVALTRYIESSHDQ